MTDETSAPAGGDDTFIATAPAETPSDMSAEDAARALVEIRKRNQPAESAKPATAESESSQEESDPPQEAPAEDPEGDDPEEQLPPIERPRSWSKDDDDDWNALPRTRQEKIAANERARESDIRQRINEASEQRKATEAEREAAVKVRQELEAGVKAARDVLEREQRSKFPDIKSWDDYERLSAEASRLSEIDPFTSLRIGNYLKEFDTHQRSMQFNAQQAKQIEDQKAQEKHNKRVSYELEQTSKLKELVPEFTDAKKYAAAKDRVLTMLTDPDDLGLKNEQLSRWMNDDIGHEILSNASMQRLMVDGLKYRDILNAPKAAAKPNLPPVQKPGAAPVRGSQNSERITNLQKQFEREPSVENATALRLARLKRA